MKQILIIGDSCIDKWVYGECKRLSPDGPVPVLVPIKEKTNTGMAGNVNDNVLALIKLVSPPNGTFPLRNFGLFLLKTLPNLGCLELELTPLFLRKSGLG